MFARPGSQPQLRPREPRHRALLTAQHLRPFKIILLVAVKRCTSAAGSLPSAPYPESPSLPQGPDRRLTTRHSPPTRPSPFSVRLPPSRCQRAKSLSAVLHRDQCRSAAQCRAVRTSSGRRAAATSRGPSSTVTHRSRFASVCGMSTLDNLGAIEAPCTEQESSGKALPVMGDSAAQWSQ
jgi:hypothetical protein